jgi:hypothetical protein
MEIMFWWYDREWRAPKHRDGKFVFEMIKNINVVFGNSVKGIKGKRSRKPWKDSPFKN